MTDALSAQDPQPVKRGRGRPRKDSTWVALSREQLGQKALEIAGGEGFAALTMQRLADEFSVTPRALYNYVQDRQEIVDMVVELFIARAPFVEFDVDDWRASVRRAYGESRAVYRDYPRASLVNLEEQITLEIGSRRTVLIERMLQFYVDIKLPLPSAVALARSMEHDVLGFALKFDYHYDRVPAEHRDVVTRLVPGRWLDAYPEINTPQCSAALQLPEQDSDELFAEMVDLRIAAIEVLLTRAGVNPN